MKINIHEVICDKKKYISENGITAKKIVWKTFASVNKYLVLNVLSDKEVFVDILETTDDLVLHKLL